LRTCTTDVEYPFAGQVIYGRASLDHLTIRSVGIEPLLEGQAIQFLGFSQPFHRPHVPLGLFGFYNVLDILWDTYYSLVILQPMFISQPMRQPGITRATPEIIA
jgi:hypothetical protein